MPLIAERQGVSNTEARKMDDNPGSSAFLIGNRRLINCLVPKQIALVYNSRAAPTS